MMPHRRIIDRDNLKRELRARSLGMRLALRGKMHQFREISVLRKLIELFEIDCIFDVGANSGQYATMLRKFVGYRGPILSFEPNPEPFAQLARRAAEDEDWRVFPVALSATTGHMPFYATHGSQFGSLHKPFDHGRTFAGKDAVKSVIDVEMATLDDLLPELAREIGFERPFLKMDTQGHDHEVVNGATNSLPAFRALQTELSVTPIYDSPADWRNFIATIESMGFEMADILSNNRGHFPRLYDVDAIFVRPEPYSDIPS